MVVMTRRIATLMLSLTLIAATACASDPPPSPQAPLGRQHPLVGRIWWSATGRFITPDTLVTQAAQAEIVLLGEVHDNPDHHALQAWMTRRILPPRAPSLVAFEMMDESQEVTLRTYVKAHPATADGLGAALQWDQSGWPDWIFYRPIVQAALDQGAELATANLNRQDVRAMARGTLAPDLPPLPEPQLNALAHEVKAAHCDLLPDSAVPGMVRVQRARDAVMAAALVGALDQGRKAVLIAGGGHVRTDRGVPAILAQQRPRARVLSIAFMEVKDGETDPAAYGALFDSASLPFDAVWFTPRAEREDPCEGLRRHLEHRKE